MLSRNKGLITYFYNRLGAVDRKRWHGNVYSSRAQDAVDLEWTRAKKFEEIPGPRILPRIGTSWTLFPVIG